MRFGVDKDDELRLNMAAVEQTAARSRSGGSGHLAT